MATAPRFWTENYLFTGATLTPSSEQTGFPATALEDQQRTYPWRTQVGWTITEHNRYIDFNRGGVKVATVALGTYSTGAALCTAIVTALEAADATPVWAADYNVAATDKFRIRDSGGAPLNFDLLWSTGANAYRSLGRSLGFTVSADDTGATSYTADSVSYQSTHHLVITLTADQALAATACAAVINRNCSTSCSIQVESSATLSWTSPTVRATLGGVGDADARQYFASQTTHQYFRLAVDDVQNTAGFFEIAVLYLSTYTPAPHCVSDNLSRSPTDYSNLNVSIGGAHFANYRSRQKRWSVEFSEVRDSSASTIRAFLESASSGENRLIDLEPDGTFPLGISGDFIYGFLPEPEVETFVPYDYWTFNFTICEAL